MSSIKNNILRNLGISYLKRSLKVINGPVFVSIFFTRKCNFDCYYCATSKNQNKVEISLKQWKNIINQIYNQGCRFITIYGGEPTLRSDLGELLKHCIDLGIFTHVVTNGSLLNEDLLEEFASYGYFLLGISIDSLSDTNFSPKIYRSQLINLLIRIKEKYPENIDYSIHIIITRENIKELIPLIKSILKLECRLSLDPVHSSLRSNQKYSYRSYCPELLLNEEDIFKLRSVIQNLKRHGIHIWSPNIYYHYMNKWYQKKYHWECDAGDLYYAIDNDGTVMLCEDVKTSIQFSDFIKLPQKERVKKIKEFKFEYCDCFKPCYWNPTNFVRNPIKDFIYNFRFK
ncbi:MAG: radical SAM protein [Promethearchaeota archaeon]